MALVAVGWPSSEPETAAMVSLLQANDIPCYVHGAALASMTPGIQIASYNAPTIMVPESVAKDAVELLSVFAAPSALVNAPRPTTFLAKLRMLAEVLAFGRFVSQPKIFSDEDAGDGT
jgi:hypothetical protein